METRKATAAELRGPEDQGLYVKKGSLVRDPYGRSRNSTWRVHEIQVDAFGSLSITFVEERDRLPVGTVELAGPGRATVNVRPERMFDLVVESDEPA